MSATQNSVPGNDVPIVSPEIYWIFMAIAIGLLTVRFFSPNFGWIDICIYSLSIISNAISLCALASFGRDRRNFRLFRISYVLGLPSLLSLLIVMAWSAIAFTRQPNRWVYQELIGLYCFVFFASLVVCVLISRRRQGLLDVLSRVRDLFKGTRPIEDVSSKHLRSMALAWFLFAFVVYFLIPAKFGRADIFLYVLFLNSILGIPYVICLFWSALDQLFWKYKSN